MDKRPYTPPTLTDHGSVVEKTNGCFGYSFEPMGELVRPDEEHGVVTSTNVKK